MKEKVWSMVGRLLPKGPKRAGKYIGNIASILRVCKMYIFEERSKIYTNNPKIMPEIPILNCFQFIITIDWSAYQKG